MELALHIRNIPENRQVVDIEEHLSSFYDQGAVELKAFGEMFQSMDRLYIGDEFCPIRLPDPNELNACCRYSQENNVTLTLLVPVLTDAWISRCISLFTCLESWYPHAEVVVNDLGTLLFLQKKHPGFQIALGRLINKGFKDPRLSTDDTDLSPEMSRLLSESTFDNPIFDTLLTRLSVRRIERDLLPHGDFVGDQQDDRQTSYYFPFGYVTTGRGCLSAIFSRNQKRSFGPQTRCSKPCNTFSLKLKSDKNRINLIQAGNTVFYLYPPKKLTALLKTSEQINHRLVYQGFIV